MRESEVKSGWQHKQQRFDGDRYGRQEPVELFQKEVTPLIGGHFLGLTAKRRDDAGEVEGSTVWLARFA